MKLDSFLIRKRYVLTYQAEYDVTIRFEGDENEPPTQTLETAVRVLGLVRLRYVGKLIQSLDLDANPRNSRVSDVTESIIETLENTPELFPLKSNGILLAASEFKKRERGRYEIKFVNTDLEGILDGGHNTLAIGRFLMERALDSAKHIKEMKAKKNWGEFKSFLRAHNQAFEVFLNSEDPVLDYQIKMELILPLGESDGELESFQEMLFSIQQARNNNAQLPESTLADAQGYFEPLKYAVDLPLRERTEWKSNDGGKIKVVDLIALTWIPLSALEMPVLDSDGRKVVPPTPVQMYSSKAVCMDKFSAFMSSPDVTNSSPGKSEVHNKAVLSAFKLAADIPRLYDAISANLPEAYNSIRNGKFGKLGPVEKLNEGSSSHKTKFYQLGMKTQSPAGYLAPVVYSIISLIKKNDDGTLEWKTDPFEFFNQHLSSAVMPIREFISEGQGREDPQKVGKEQMLYRSCAQEVRLAILDS